MVFVLLYKTFFQTVTQYTEQLTAENTEARGDATCSLGENKQENVCHSHQHHVRNETLALGILKVLYKGVEN